MTRGTVQLRWPEVAMEVLPNAMDGQADRLDEAMNVLSHLLVDLESELEDIAKNDAKKLPPIPSPEGLTNKSGQLDSALNVLNAQLIELENELQKDGFAPSHGDGKLEETKEPKIQASSQGEKGPTPKQTQEVLATPLNVVPTMLLHTQPGQPQPHPGVAKALPGAPVMAQMPWGWRLPDQRLPQAPPQQFQPRTSPRPSRLSQEPPGQKLAVAPPQVASGAAMASAAMSATANMTPSTAPVLTYSGRAISPAPVGTGKARQPATPPPLVLSGSAFRSPSEGRIGAFRPEHAKSPMQRQHLDGWRSPTALPTAPSAFPMCRSTPSPRPSVGQGFGNSPAGNRLASTHGHAKSSWRSPSEGRIGSGPHWGPADGSGQTRTPRFDKAAQSPMRRQAGEGLPSPAPLPHSFTICRSTGSLTSSNPSFYMSAMGGGGFNQAAVPAAAYIVDLADPVDQLLGNALRMLDLAAASKLTLRRLSPGRYEIDGRRVTLRWEQGGTGLVVIEDEVLDARGSAMPLVAYLKSAGNVAASLSGQRADMPKIARVPKAQRLTFDDDAPAEQNLASQIEKLGSERCESMRLAVEQARLREEAAEKYEKQNRGHVLPPPPPPISSSMQFL